MNRWTETTKLDQWAQRDQTGPMSTEHLRWTDGRRHTEINWWAEKCKDKFYLRWEILSLIYMTFFIEIIYLNIDYNLFLVQTVVFILIIKSVTIDATFQTHIHCSSSGVNCLADMKYLLIIVIKWLLYLISYKNHHL